ncbi:hypothetical protein HanIR_Chr02g0052761 [Helianthus annuus]|nr:hypothetical protein HanIR_Chr02g0052761 [Helianthus annuus]
MHWAEICTYIVEGFDFLENIKITSHHHQSHADKEGSTNTNRVFFKTGFRVGSGSGRIGFYKIGVF